MRCKFYAIVLSLGVFAVLCIYYTASKSSIHTGISPPFKKALQGLGSIFKS